MINLRGHFDYRIGWLLLYYSVSKNFAFQLICLPQNNVRIKKLTTSGLMLYPDKVDRGLLIAILLQDVFLDLNVNT